MSRGGTVGAAELIPEAIAGDAMRNLLLLAAPTAAVALVLAMVELSVQGGWPTAPPPALVAISAASILLGLVGRAVKTETLHRHRRALLGAGIALCAGSVATSHLGLQWVAVVALLVCAIAVGQVFGRQEALAWYAVMVVSLVGGLAVAGTARPLVVTSGAALLVVAHVAEDRNRRLLDLLVEQTAAAAQDEMSQQLLASVTTMSDLDEHSVVRELLAAVASLGYPSAAVVIPGTTMTVGFRGAHLAELEVDDPSTGPLHLADGEGRPVTAWLLASRPDAIGRLVASPAHGGVEPWQHETVGRLVEVARSALVNAARFAEERASAERLARLDLERNDFVSSVSHELRTPLTVVKGLGHTLATGMLDLDSPAGRDVLSRIDANAQRLDTMLTTLLDVSRVHRRGLEVDRRAVDLGLVVATALDRLSPLAAQHHLELTVDGDVRIAADAALLDHVVENLVVNAVKYTPPGTSIRVAVTSPTDGGARVVVADDGPGIDEDDLPRLTDRFFRGGDANTRDTSGLGLGLSFVADILAAHGSELEVGAGPCGGASFAFTLLASADDVVPRLPAVADGR